MGVALYGRVSTAEQNAAMQIDEFRAYCGRRQWEIVEEFIDTGVSGSKESRPALNRLLADAKRRRFDTVLVYRYDRFARSLRQLVNALAEFDALGIHFVSLHEGVDTSMPNGRLVFGIFASIAEFERELIRGRVRSGLAAARARGRRIGRPNSDGCGEDCPTTCFSRLLARDRTEGRCQCENGEAISRGAWQNPVRFGGCKWFRISATLGVFQEGRIHQVLPRFSRRHESAGQNSTPSGGGKPQALKGKGPACNSWVAHIRFSSIRDFRASSSSFVMPCRAIAVARYKAGTCFILLPCSTLRRSFWTSGSAPTFKNTLYASGMDRVFSIRPCLTRMR
jgi:Resolvase, N terminal domain